ncbi:hypothetical protein HKBW3S42_01802, partial [Candidatus Hakubella thermalkaliphila]
YDDEGDGWIGEEFQQLGPPIIDTQDFLNIVTSFCTRVYGQRRSKRKTERIITEL